MDYDKIDNTKLNNAIKALNEFVNPDGQPYIGTKIQFVAKKKEARVTAFTESYEALANRFYDENDDFNEDIPDAVTNFYTVLYPETQKDDAGGGTDGTPKGDGKNTPSAGSTPKNTGGGTSSKKKTTGTPAAKRGPSEVKAFLIAKIEEAKWTRKQIIDNAVAKFPDKAKSTISTYISDGFSEKYCSFEKLLVKGKDDIIKFGKKKG